MDHELKRHSCGASHSPGCLPFIIGFPPHTFRPAAVTFNCGCFELPISGAGATVAKNVGLFNPLTLSGTIIVNGAVSSVHSEWFLDSVFDAIGRPDLLPATYQVSHWLRWLQSEPC